MSDYITNNRALWTRANAAHTAEHARQAWMEEHIHWGVWHQAENEIRVLPDVHGLDVIELGCGTAYFGAWLKKAGARRVVGVDITPAQLATASEMNEEFGLGLEFLEANAEDVPLPSQTFDLALSEHGASIWCDPYRWIPEAGRLLRARGELIFMRNSDFVTICSQEEDRVSERLLRPLRGMNRIDWASDGPSTEFHISVSDMFQLLRRTGFDVMDFRHLYAPDGAVDHPYYSYVPADWARKWPHEEIWRARKS